MSYRIIEADLLSAFDLSVDVRGRRLIDNQHGAISVGILKSAPCSSISVVDQSCKF